MFFTPKLSISSTASPGGQKYTIPTGGALYDLQEFINGGRERLE
jgi:hypothetical protein